VKLTKALSIEVANYVSRWMHTKMPHAHSHGSATGEEFAGGPQRTLPAPLSLPNIRAHTPFENDGEGPYLDEKKQMDFSMKESGDTDLELSSETPPWFVAFYEEYVRQRNEMAQNIKRYAPSLPPYSNQTNMKAISGSKNDSDGDSLADTKEYGVVDLEHGSVDPMVYKKMSMEITLLEGGILFHSVFVGMTISITTDGFIVLLIAILFHQTFEGLGLGSRIAAVPYPKGSIKPWLLVFAFGTTAPIGQAIGLITRNTYDPNSAFALILVGFFNAFSSGLLIYAGLVDLLHADFLSEEADRLLTNKKKILAFTFVLMGGKSTSYSLSSILQISNYPLAAGMSIVGAFA
jgi:zinc transporter 1/2/3